MRIIILSSYDGFSDEGALNTSVNIYSELLNQNEVFLFNIRRNIFSKKFWGDIKRFKPHIVHIFLRPTLHTLILVKLIKLYLGNSKIILSSLQPPNGYSYESLFYRFLKPDLVLVQSNTTNEFWQNLGFRTRYLPSGVDIRKFSPVDDTVKNCLKKKYRGVSDEYVFLHVGHILPGRNLKILCKLKDIGVDVLIIGSITFKPDPALKTSLERDCCNIEQKYFNNIEELYQLADCYIFPTFSTSNSIEVPLSVMEAMSCNLPVVTTRFGGLDRIFSESDGLFFAETDDELIRKAKLVLSGVPVVKTREKVLNYSWKMIVLELERIYFELLGDDHGIK